jgi:hypothetical protein
LPRVYVLGSLVRRCPERGVHEWSDSEDLHPPLHPSADASAPDLAIPLKAAVTG